VEEVFASKLVFGGFEDARAVGESMGLGSGDLMIGGSEDVMVAGSAGDLMGLVMGDRGNWSAQEYLLPAL